MNKKIYEISFSLRQQRNRLIKKTVFFVLLFFLLSNIILSKIISPVRQNSISMEPNIRNGTFLLVTPLFRTIKRGQIVLLPPEEEPLPFHKKCADTILRALTFQKIHPWTDDGAIIRRVLAMPGDTIYMKDFILYIMPAGQKHFFTEFELNQVPYSVDITVPPSQWNTQIGVRGNFGQMTLGEDEYFILGDNRLSTLDSRIFGAIPGSRIKKSVLLSYYPFKNFRLFLAKKNALR